MMLTDVRVETEVTITDGKASMKYKTRSDQDYLVPIALTPSLLTTVLLHTIAKSVITNADLLNEEYEQMDVLESISKFVVSEANYHKEVNIPAIWWRWIFFWWFLCLHTGMCIHNLNMALMLWRYVSHSLQLLITGHLLDISSNGTLGDRSDISTVEKAMPRGRLHNQTTKSRRQKDKEAYEARVTDCKRRADAKAKSGAVLKAKAQTPTDASPAAVLKAKVRAAAQKK
jgi:hypothetical protein